MAIERAEYQKVEPTFEVNRFERPLELTQVEAWTRLVLRILFMEKGTMPSDPNMGCNITAETYQDIETLKGTIRKNLDKQVRSYLPDIHSQEWKFLQKRNLSLMEIHKWCIISSDSNRELRILQR